MIIRMQYRGCLKEQINQKAFQYACMLGKEKGKEEIAKGRLLGVSLYRFESMCFLYYEAIGQLLEPQEFLDALLPYMEIWSEGTGKTVWAPMYCVYYHRVPKSIIEWEANRQGKRRIGRIAFLQPEKLTAYI